MNYKHDPSKWFCGCCRFFKDRSEFGVRPGGTPRSYCKRCSSRKAAAWKQANREKVNAAAMRRYYKNEKNAARRRILTPKRRAILCPDETEGAF